MSKNIFACRYHTTNGAYIALVKKGRVKFTCLMVTQFPLRLIRVPLSEDEYMDPIQDPAGSIKSMRGVFSRHGGTKSVALFLDAASSTL